MREILIYFYYCEALSSVVCGVWGLYFFFSVLSFFFSASLKPGNVSRKRTSSPEEVWQTRLSSVCLLFES